MRRVEDSESDDDGTNERTPLLDRIRRQPQEACSHGLISVVLILCLATFVTRVEAIITFPYLRTLQRCSSQDSGLYWSGSLFCTDRALVARASQADANYMQCIGLILNSLFLPALGWFGDRCGRRPLVALYFGGLAIESGINASVHSIGAFFCAVAFQKCTDGLTPALIAMISDLFPAEDRMYAYLMCVLGAAPVYTLTYGAVAYSVLSHHLRSYASTWSILGLMSLFCACLVFLAPETLTASVRAAATASAKESAAGAVLGRPSQGPADVGGTSSSSSSSSSRSRSRRRADESRMCLPMHLLLCCCHGCSRVKGGHSPATCAASPVFAACANPSLRFVMIIEVPALLAFAAFSTLDGFALIAYGWEQESMVYVRFATLPAAGLASLLGVRLMRRIEPLRTLQIGLGCLFCSLLAMSFAQWHVGLLYLALVLAGGSTLAVLPILRLIGTQAGATQQASASAMLLAVAHAAQGVGLLSHAYIFDNAAAHGVLFAPFAFGALASFFALAFALCFPPPEHAWLVDPELPQARRDL